MDRTTQPRVKQVDRRAVEVRVPGERLCDVRRIVVVRDDRLGDVVLSLPAVGLLRRTYPEARLALMLREELHPLGRMVQGVDELLVTEGSVEGCRRRLSGFGTDLLVSISRGVTPAIAGALAGVTYRVGTGYRAYSRLFTHRVCERRSAGERHELEYALSFAHRAGARAEEARFPIDVPRAARSEADSWLESRRVPDRFVLLHPGTGGSCPPWPADRFVELAGLLIAERIAVVVSIGPADAAVTRALDAAPGSVRRLPRVTQEIDTLAGLLLRAAVVVSNSTGPLHLAAALGASTLGLFAPWSTCGVTRWGPYAPNGWAIEAHDPEAVGWSRARRVRDGKALLSLIPPEIVAQATATLLDGGLPT
jgi:heptosyltransferase-3